MVCFVSTLGETSCQLSSSLNPNRIFVSIGYWYWPADITTYYIYERCKKGRLVYGADAFRFDDIQISILNSFVLVFNSVYTSGYPE